MCSAGSISISSDAIYIYYNGQCLPRLYVHDFSVLLFISLVNTCRLSII